MAKVNLKDIQNHGEDIAALKDKVAGLNYLMVGLVVVLFIFVIGMAVGLGAIIIDSFRSREASYQSLIEKIDSFNQSQVIVNLQNQVDNLKKNNPYLK